MNNEAIIAVLTNEPQSANEIAAKLEKSASTVRKWLKKLREAGTIAYIKVGSSIHYNLVVAAAVVETVETVIETINEAKPKPTRQELRSKILGRAESHRQKMLSATTRSEARTWRHRYHRAHSRAAALAC